MIADGLQLIRAEVLKLRASRGQLLLSVLLTSGLVAVLFAVLAILHASDAGTYGPAGGAANFGDAAVNVLTLMAIVVGAMLGSTAGAGDGETGVLRDLVATGRSRLVLYAARLPGLLAVLVPLLLAAVGIALVCSLALAGGKPTPGLADVGDGVASVLAGGLVAGAISLGLATLIGSRGPVIALTLGLLLVVSTALMEVSALGDARVVLPGVAIGALGGGSDLPVELSRLGGLVVLLAWSGACLAAGARRIATVEL
jgi:hypothetical protein